MNTRPTLAIECVVLVACFAIMFAYCMWKAFF